MYFSIIVLVRSLGHILANFEIYFSFVLGWGTKNKHLRVPRDFGQKCIGNRVFSDVGGVGGVLA